MKRILAILFNLFIGIACLGAWIYMTFFAVNAATLQANGLSSLKFFTVLSNLFNGGVALLYASWLIRATDITPARKTLKLAATSAVGLTFVTVMAFLGPLYGFDRMFNGANLWFHLLLPIASFITFIFFERDSSTIPLRCSLWAMLPTALYSVGYLGNIALNGMGALPDSNDFYGFLLWGNGIGAVIAVTILLTTWLIALVLGKLGGAYASKAKKRS